MSYTLTIDAPERAVCDPLAERKVRSVYSSRSVTVTPTELGEMFVAFLAERCADGHDKHKKCITDYVLSSNKKSASGAAFARAWGKIGVADGELDLSRPNEKLREVNFE